MKDIKALMKDYAELLVKAGINIQKGQRLVISSPVECAEFARMCALEAYEAGCKEVLMMWTDEVINRAKFLYADEEVFDNVHSWDIDFRDKLSEEGAGWISIFSEDPESLKGVDPERIKRAQISRGKAFEKFRERQMSSEVPWAIGSIPTEKWAKAVFPEMETEEAMARLWDEILAACRVDGGDAIANWKAHSNELRTHCDILNEYNFKTLRYKNSAGTDVTVELPEGHFWGGGEEKAASGVIFSPNLPTEEVFTLPKKDGINGRIVATKPLSHNGSLIDGFWFEVRDGKIVDLHADQGEDVLRAAISVDEGASYFGEVALVPYDSPISNSGVLFLNTLFDENASCHFAFGHAYPNLKGAENMTEDELKAAGANVSITHVDFMIGSPDLEITGTTHDGEEVAVFRNGNFVF